MPSAQEASDRPERLRVQIRSIRPHDPSAFTQGLLVHNGFFYESTGQYGASRLRKVDMHTGEVLQQIALSPDFFGEGLALVGERLIQITWREQVAFVYDLETFEPLETFTYVGEGWGLCYDAEGDALYMSNGSHFLYVRDPKTFEERRRLEIILDGVPIRNLNELECVGDSIYANIWFSDQILRIDKHTGRITAIIDASNLLTPEERQAVGMSGTLNGIAYDAENERFFITGKLWMWLFEVDFVPELPETYVTPTPLLP
ncbi:MAG: glutaminyl-peptide cyclotransferase [Candidatus Thermofonsia Clade 1 bacterium]|uniref:Glutaminyl-peptide cyclotransferase n=1 Tax=Candidatus Thermofonsia Clade 1 bacterium TaxID=2364210 RepID=A0A2M8PD40_9CHLR|nr:MAG: glutaminyl-peptide cyclotransferase [Candidatus Thermofonsia Clade 1 bacterium]RMF49105.1 MAG: glutaminyl-peptide cyclotransferase [Chloroflexota bacterium]